MKTTLVFLIALFFSHFSYADTATATQTLHIVIPKIALIDVDNTAKPLNVSLDPISEAGNNFAEKTFIGLYDVTSNIHNLKLYAKSDKDLINDYNISLKVHEARSFYRELTPVSQRVSTQSVQAKHNQPLTYKIKPHNMEKTIPYGNLDVQITYTLVEP